VKPKIGINIWLLVLALIAIVVAVAFMNPKPTVNAIPMTTFLEKLERGEVASLKLRSTNNATEVEGEYRDKAGSFITTIPLGDKVLSAEYLKSRNVSASVSTESSLGWLALVFQLAPLLLMVALLWYLLRGMRGGNDGAMSFAKSKARMVSDGAPKTTFKEVAGCDEAKEELAEVVDFLKNPSRFHEIGARIPHGVLLVGPPGSGKTLLAKAVAGEARVPFFTISGSDFVEMFVGVGAARVRDLFEQAKKAAPCIVFIDEIDAVGRKRGSGLGGGNDEREQTLNQLLVEMDGFETKHDIIILAATNRPDVLDAALLRPGRFDRQVTVDAPDVKGREEILRVHARKKPLEEGVDLRQVAKRTPGFVGADLENLLNEAALLAARASRRKISMRDIDEAADRVMMGPERKSAVITEADKRITAYHEVGHALAMNLLPMADRAHKLTIVPRGRAAGYALPMPSDQMHWSKNRLLDRIAVALAGQAAEEIVFGDVTTGASNDFQRATQIARRMVTEWGMSPTLGHVAHVVEQESYLGYAGETRNYSDDTARQIDSEVKGIIENQYLRVKTVLETNRELMERVVVVLMERETLGAEEFQLLLDGGDLPPDENHPPRNPQTPTKQPEPFIPPNVLKPGRA
jgi:cell division protease FtsH